MNAAYTEDVGWRRRACHMLWSLNLLCFQMSASPHQAGLSSYNIHEQLHQSGCELSNDHIWMQPNNVNASTKCLLEHNLHACILYSSPSFLADVRLGLISGSASGSFLVRFLRTLTLQSKMLPLTKRIKPWSGREDSRGKLNIEFGKKTLSLRDIDMMKYSILIYFNITKIQNTMTKMIGILEAVLNITMTGEK